MVLWTHVGKKSLSFTLVFLCLLTSRAFAGWREAAVDQAHELSVKAFFQRVCSAEMIYFFEERVTPDGRALGPHFISAGPTPSEIPRGKAVAADWNAGGWRDLSISQSQPVAFRYLVIAEGAGEAAKFKIRAEADLAGDGKLTVYEMQGKPPSGGEPACGPLIRASL